VLVDRDRPLAGPGRVGSLLRTHRSPSAGRTASPSFQT
jgi:hypothetical protein